VTELVPNRTCGGCTVCCRELTVDIPELRKPSGIPCDHCDEGRGCRVYATRPALCRDWHCGWRGLSDLDDAWRPDRCGVLILSADEADVPPEYSGGPGYRLQLTRPLSPAMWDSLAHWIMRLIGDGIPVFVSVSGRPGHSTGRVFLNDGLKHAARLGDHAEVSRLLERALLTSLRYVGEPISLPPG
jgi:hypothetical protein